MNLQYHRIEIICEALSLTYLFNEYDALTQEFIKQEMSYVDYLENCLESERKARQERSRSMLFKIAGFPVIKRLDNYDYGFAVGSPKAQIEALKSLSFIERQENVVLFGPSGVGKTHIAIDLGYLATSRHAL